MTGRIFCYNLNMKILIKNIKELILKDQSQIKLFRQGSISHSEWIKKSKEMARVFVDLLDRYGFPYKNLVSEDVYRASIILSLHLDLRVLKYVFNVYVKNASSKKIDPEHKAVFIDKILILSDKPQLYGTQYKMNENTKVKLLPVEDEKNLEKRRKDVGLQPLDEYLKLINH